MTTENDVPELRRVYGLLVSEWVTYGMLAIVVGALIFGFKVGGERDAQAERAMATLEALTREAERIVADGRVLVCDDGLLDAETLANEYLTLAIRPVPLDEDDESLGFGPGLHVDVVEDKVSGDTWDTAKRLMALVREEASEGEEGEVEADMDEVASRGIDDDTEAGDEEDEDKPKSRLRNVRKTSFLEEEEYLRYSILASETAICSQDV